MQAGDVASLLARFAELRQKAFTQTGKWFPIIVIQDAVHRALEQEEIESHIVDPASIATSRRRWRAKTDRIDGEALLRALLAYQRANLGYVQWSRHRRLRKKIVDVFAENAKC